MNVERFAVEVGEAGAGAVADALRALTPAGVSVSGTVSEIVASVRTRGEQALLEYVERFDGVTGPLRVEQPELDAALAQLDPDVRRGLEVSIANVRAVAEAGLVADKTVELPEGQSVTIRDLAGDGDHYAATVIAESFRGKSRVQQHKIVYDALKGEMGGKLHALALQTATPEP